MKRSSAKWPGPRLVPRPGFTLTEGLIVAILLGVIMTMAVPNVTRSMKRTRSERALMVIKGDMENAFSLASRQGRPVQIDFDTNLLSYSIKDRASGNVLLERRFDDSTPYVARGMWVSSPTVSIFPNGFASMPYWVRFDWGDNDYRWVLVRRNGHMRVWGWL